MNMSVFFIEKSKISLARLNEANYRKFNLYSKLKQWIAE